MSRDISQGIDPSMQYLSSGFKGNSVDTTLTRMVGKDVQSKAQFCAECGTKIETGYRPPNASASSPEVFCKDDYEKLFTQQCDGCHKPIMGEYVNANGKKYHAQCHSQDLQCATCSKMIFGEMVQGCGKFYHPKCFNCTLCYTPLGTNFMERSGYPYCNKCINEPPATSVKVNGDSAKRDEKNKDIKATNASKQEFQSNLQKGKLFCAECGNVIGVGEAVTHNESTFHIMCFACVKCRTPLHDVGFKDINGEPHCPSCAGSSGSTGGFCAGCGQKLSGSFVNAMGQKWHKDCFVCASCKKAFTTGYAEKNGEPYCSNCISKSSKPTYTTQTMGERKPGFMVDPRTGQKKYTWLYPVICHAIKVS